MIGRSNGWTEDQEHALHGLNRRMNGISVMTYDHLLAQGERLVEMMSPPSTKAEQADADDDDVPW